MDNDYVTLALQRLCQALVCRIAATAVVQDNFKGKKTTTEQQNIEKCGKGYTILQSRSHPVTDLILVSVIPCACYGSRIHMFLVFNQIQLMFMIMHK